MLLPELQRLLEFKLLQAAAATAGTASTTGAQSHLLPPLPKLTATVGRSAAAETEEEQWLLSSHLPDTHPCFPLLGSNWKLVGSILEQAACRVQLPVKQS